MTTNKSQRLARLAAAIQLIADAGEEASTRITELAAELASQFANDRMKRQTAKTYVLKVLAIQRGETIIERRGGKRPGGGLPRGSRKCKSCGIMNIAVVTEGNNRWQCNHCQQEHIGREAVGVQQ